jgi:hypothetical protein
MRSSAIYGVVVVVACVVEVTAPTVVDGADGRVVGDGVGLARGGTRRGAVEAIVVDNAGGIVAAGFGAVRFGAALVVVKAEPDPARAARTVVGVLVVDAAGKEVVTTGAGCDDLSWLATFNGRDPPGGPPAMSAPMHKAARPSRPPQPHQASRARCCPRDRSIERSSANFRPT